MTLTNDHPYSIKLYSTEISHTTNSSSVLSLASISSDTGLLSLILPTFSYNDKTELESEQIEAVGLIKQDIPVQRESFEFETVFKISLDGASRLSVISLLNQTYKFIAQVSSPYNYNINEANDVIAVSLTKFEEEIEGGLKTVKMSFIKRKPN